MVPACLALLLFAAAPPSTDARPTVALLRMEAQKGVDVATAQVLADHLVGSLRKTARFSRVVSGRDLEAVLDLQRQKQLLDCDTESCMVEIAGALGVDFLVVGGAARLGTTYVVNLRIVEASSGIARGSFNETLPGAQEDALLASVERGVEQMMREWSPGPSATPPPATTATPAKTTTAAAAAPATPAKTTKAATAAPATPAKTTPAKTTTAATATAAKTTTTAAASGGTQAREAPKASGPADDLPAGRKETSAGGGPGIPKVAALGGGAALLGVALLGGVAALALAAGGWGLKGFINIVPSPLGAQLTAVQVAYVGAWVAGGLGVVLALLVLVGGAGALVAGVVL